MIIAIASGKGGTGKTTVAVNLARICGTDWQLLDCDVEEPNDHLFLPGEKIHEEKANVLIPQVNKDLCNACGECSRFCEFNAIVTFGTAPLIFPEMCHSCGGCVEVCPQQAIYEVDRPIGTISTIKSGNVTLVQGCLDIGVAMAPPLIGEVRSRISAAKNVIIDAPPGTSCPVVAALREVDFAVLVTEPTPFGLNDLKLAVAMTRELQVPFGIVINRDGSGDDKVEEYCREEDIVLLAKIPYDRRIAEAYSRGKLMVEALPEYSELFSDLLSRIHSLSVK
jgi:MinD superfamily P-loop ATPase